MQVASVAFEHQRFADTYATHLTCEILRFNLPPKAHVTYVTHLTCEILRLINKHDLKDYLLTPRTNVRIASAKHQNAFKFAALTLRTNVRVASFCCKLVKFCKQSYAPHERAGCFSKIAQLCVMPVRIKCTGFIPYREFGYYSKAELRPLARFKDAKSPYSYANAPALLCELAVRTRLLF